MTDTDSRTRAEAYADRVERYQQEQDEINVVLGSLGISSHADRLQAIRASAEEIERLKVELHDWKQRYFTIERINSDFSHRITTLTDALRRLEWLELGEKVNQQFVSNCPGCLRRTEWGHADDCWLAAALTHRGL